MSSDRLLTVDEAAKRLAVGRSTLWEWIRDGDFPAVRHRRRGAKRTWTRVRASDVNRWIDAHVVGSPLSDEGDTERPESSSSSPRSEGSRPSSPPPE